MLTVVQSIGWIACVLYSTIPAFWLLIHPRAEYWRARQRSPYQILLPVWIGMWIAVAAITARWRTLVLYETPWAWISAGILFCLGLILYRYSHADFSLSQLAGLPEVRSDHNRHDLITTGVRAHIRHPIYLGHLCELLAWSVGSGLVVCWALTGVAVATGAVMIRMEDAELAKRFGEEYLDYRRKVGALLPRLRA